MMTATNWRRWGLMVLVLLAVVTGYAVLSGGDEAGPRRGPTVLAAASLQETLEEVGDAWAKQGHARPSLSFAGSSALARQIEAGAPADIFLSADEKWMDELEKHGDVVAGTRVTLLGNRLVLIGAQEDGRTLELKPGTGLTVMLGDGRLAVADTDAVPAGKYAKAALQSLGLWEGVADKLAPAENVRAALAMVERGQAPLGVVYATDAKASNKVRVMSIFPDESHPPIRYPVALLAGSRNADAEDFRRFLMSDQAKAIFARHGFEPLAQPVTDPR